MKKLEIERTELIIGGGMNQRNCMLTGAGILLSGLIGFAAPGAWAATAGFIGVGLSGDCF